MTTYSDRLRLDIALLVGEEGRAAALYIDRDNRSSGTDSIAAAVRSGRTFAVRPRPWIVVGDFDSPNRTARKCKNLIKRLRAQALRPVVVNSGGVAGDEPKLHLFVRVVDPELADEVRGLIRKAGGDPRPGRQGRIRPPLTPHRSGHGYSEPVDMTPRRAVEALSPKPLSAATTRLLKDGDTRGRYSYPDGRPDRSRGEIAIANAFVAAGYTFDEFEDALLHPANRGGEKTQSLRAERARRQRCQRLYDDACAYLRRNQRDPRSSEAREELDRLFQAVVAALRGMPDGLARTYLALIMDAYRVGHTTHRIAVRELAEKAGLSTGEVTKSLMELEDMDLIRLGGRRTSLEARQARILTTNPAFKTLRAIRKRKPIPPTSGGGVELNVSLARDLPHALRLDHDAFREGGIRTTAWRVFLILGVVDGEWPLSTKEIAAEVGRHAGTVRRALAMMSGLGLAERRDDGHVLGAASLDQVVGSLSLRPMAALERERHREESGRFHAGLTLKPGMTPKRAPRYPFAEARARMRAGGASRRGGASRSTRTGETNSR